MILISDVSFIKEYIENSEIAEETVDLIADGAYASEETETGYKVIGCPAGNSPKSGSYIKQTDSIRVSFYKYQCEGCPYQSKCNSNIKSRAASLLIPLRSRRRILDSAEVMDDETRKLIGRICNSVEMVPSIIRNKY